MFNNNKLKAIKIVKEVFKVEIPTEFVIVIIVVATSSFLNYLFK